MARRKQLIAAPEHLPSAESITAHGLTLSDYYRLRSIFVSQNCREQFSAYGNFASFKSLLDGGWVVADRKVPTDKEIAKIRKQLAAQYRLIAACVERNHLTAATAAIDRTRRMWTKMHTPTEAYFKLSEKAMRMLHETARKSAAAPMAINANVRIEK